MTIFLSSSPTIKPLGTPKWRQVVFELVCKFYNPKNVLFHNLCCHLATIVHLANHNVHTLEWCRAFNAGYIIIAHYYK